MSEKANGLDGVINQVIDICKSVDEGVSQQDLISKLKEVPVSLQAEAINKLLQQHKLEVYQHPTTGLVYKYLVQERAVKFRGLNSEELLVYQIIQSTQSMGIWTRDLKLKSNLQQPQVVKILKTLESRKLIKSIKSVANKNRKVYMIYELEPDKEITGGAWYTENEFDYEFIEVLKNSCYKYVSNVQQTTLEDIFKFIRDKGVSNVELNEEDLSSILNVLVFDGLLEEKICTDGKKVFIPALQNRLNATAVSELPCDKCPVFQDCKFGGIVNPTNCIYLKEWLDIPSKAIKKEEMILD